MPGLERRLRQTERCKIKSTLEPTKYKHTKVQNSGLLAKSVRGGIILGRACPAENFDTGMRGLIPIVAMPARTKFITAQIRNVHRNPTLSSRALIASG